MLPLTSPQTADTGKQPEQGFWTVTPAVQLVNAYESRKEIEQLTLGDEDITKMLFADMVGVRLVMELQIYQINQRDENDHDQRSNDLAMGIVDEIQTLKIELRNIWVQTSKAKESTRLSQSSLQPHSSQSPDTITHRCKVRHRLLGFQWRQVNRTRHDHIHNLHRSDHHLSHAHNSHHSKTTATQTIDISGGNRSPLWSHMRPATGGSESQGGGGEGDERDNGAGEGGGGAGVGVGERTSLGSSVPVSLGEGLGDSVKGVRGEQRDDGSVDGGSTGGNSGDESVSHPPPCQRGVSSVSQTTRQVGYERSTHPHPNLLTHSLLPSTIPRWKNCHLNFSARNFAKSSSSTSTSTTPSPTSSTFGLLDEILAWQKPQPHTNPTRENGVWDLTASDLNIFSLHFALAPATHEARHCPCRPTPPSASLQPTGTCTESALRPDSGCQQPSPIAPLPQGDPPSSHSSLSHNAALAPPSQPPSPSPLPTDSEQTLTRTTKDENSRRGSSGGHGSMIKQGAAPLAGLVGIPVGIGHGTHPLSVQTEPELKSILTQARGGMKVSDDERSLCSMKTSQGASAGLSAPLGDVEAPYEDSLLRPLSEFTYVGCDPFSRSKVCQCQTRHLVEQARKWKMSVESFMFSRTIDKLLSSTTPIMSGETKTDKTGKTGKAETADKSHKLDKKNKSNTTVKADSNSDVKRRDKGLEEPPEFELDFKVGEPPENGFQDVKLRSKRVLASWFEREKASEHSQQPGGDGEGEREGLCGAAPSRPRPLDWFMIHHDSHFCPPFLFRFSIEWLPCSSMAINRLNSRLRYLSGLHGFSMIQLPLAQICPPQGSRKCLPFHQPIAVTIPSACGLAASHHHLYTTQGTTNALQSDRALSSASTEKGRQPPRTRRSNSTLRPGSSVSEDSMNMGVENGSDTGTNRLPVSESQPISPPPSVGHGNDPHISLVGTSALGASLGLSDLAAPPPVPGDDVVPIKMVEHTCHSGVNLTHSKGEQSTSLTPAKRGEDTTDNSTVEDNFSIGASHQAIRGASNRRLRRHDERHKQDEDERDKVQPRDLLSLVSSTVTDQTSGASMERPPSSSASSCDRRDVECLSVPVGDSAFAWAVKPLEAHYRLLKKLLGNPELNFLFLCAKEHLNVWEKREVDRCDEAHDLMLKVPAIGARGWYLIERHGLIVLHITEKQMLIHIHYLQLKWSKSSPEPTPHLECQCRGDLNDARWRTGRIRQELKGVRKTFESIFGDNSLNSTHTIAQGRLG
eukprot:GHVN01026322.1.p1 GENE.GHVN01026322.1~~GHVN01026322.1.p1  ORF type:complete len:1439 (-),score=346.53 GHVN01026322.1:597-4349(-)